MPTNPKDDLIPKESTSVELILHVQEQLGISQHEVARLCGINHTSVWRWVNGRCEVNPMAVRLLGMALEVPGAIQWLMNVKELMYGQPKVHEEAPVSSPLYVESERAPWNQ